MRAAPRNGATSPVVLPKASVTTLSLLIVVAVSTAIVGVATAWLVVAFDFPGRRFFSWALVLPLAVPPYLAAYAFAEFFLYTGPVQALLRWLFGFENIRDYWFPDIRSTPAAPLSSWPRCSTRMSISPHASSF